MASYTAGFILGGNLSSQNCGIFKFKWFAAPYSVATTLFFILSQR